MVAALGQQRTVLVPTTRTPMPKRPFHPAARSLTRLAWWFATRPRLVRLVLMVPRVFHGRETRKELWAPLLLVPLWMCAAAIARGVVPPGGFDVVGFLERQGLVGVVWGVVLGVVGASGLVCRRVSRLTRCRSSRAARGCTSSPGVQPPEPRGHLPSRSSTHVSGHRRQQTRRTGRPEAREAMADPGS